MPVLWSCSVFCTGNHIKTPSDESYYCIDLASLFKYKMFLSCQGFRMQSDFLSATATRFRKS